MHGINFGEIKEFQQKENLNIKIIDARCCS